MVLQHQTVARAWNPGRRWVQSNAVGHSLELDLTWFNVERGAVRESVPSAGFKWSPRLNGEHAAVPLRFVAGEMVQIRAGDPHAGHWTYLMLNANYRTRGRTSQADTRQEAARCLDTKRKAFRWGWNSISIITGCFKRIGFPASTSSLI